MPPIKKAQTPEMVAVWVEDNAARIWQIDVASGAMDELARLNVEGIPRADVLDLVRHMVRMRYGLTPRVERMADMPTAVLPTPETPAPRPREIRKPQKVERHPSGARKRSRADIVAARENSQAILAYIAANPGRTTAEVSEALALEGRQGGGKLGVLARWNKAEYREGKWYAVTNGGG